ncbi:hypothetical protein H8B02_09015 [Bradyrhizobium sp. Pear77]|uniref:hypothetical protein n=1 Tax=Bradyrhizobium TaxID=374 RepID=UPI001E28FFE9|nr:MULTISPECIES: hypothetical protein [Bradyrhizobium]MCC8953587.1 hypothetical protein [Bradyrhizobium altum]MCC8962902.1 hypothetical protein [Bradyrhizobium oropedii]
MTTQENVCILSSKACRLAKCRFARCTSDILGPLMQKKSGFNPPEFGSSANLSERTPLLKGDSIAERLSQVEHYRPDNVGA